MVVALANPRTERALMSLGGALASHEGGRVIAIHVVTVPDQTPLEAAAENRSRIDATSADLLEAAAEDAAAFGIPVETKTVLSHRGLEEVLDVARSNDADALVMGYGGARLTGGRVEGAADELAADLPCDVLVFDGETFDPTDVLVPTAGGHSSDLSAAVAVALRETVGADVTLLYVAEDDEPEADAREFLSAWATDHDLPDAEIRLETGDVESTIARHGVDASLVVVGATERGLLTRIVRGSLAYAVLEGLDTPVVMVERPSSRSLWQRLLGRR